MASTQRSTFSWIPGSFAIYARSANDAQQVFERIRDAEGWVEPFGTSLADSAEEITWVNTRYVSSASNRKASH